MLSKWWKLTTAHINVYTTIDVTFIYLKRKFCILFGITTTFSFSFLLLGLFLVELKGKSHSLYLKIEWSFQIKSLDDQKFNNNTKHFDVWIFLRWKIAIVHQTHFHYSSFLKHLGIHQFDHIFQIKQTKKKRRNYFAMFIEHIFTFQTGHKHWLSVSTKNVLV